MSIEFYSDYIMCTHMPAKLNLQSYTDNQFPIYLDIGGVDVEFIYWHILKNREGIPDQILPMLNNLRVFDFIEVPTSDFTDYCNQFNNGGRCKMKK